ncbi:glycosyltransferase family 4 protein [uncultured Thiothrix sp.]|mgnify:CR=1 FL=1|uniref:glycosyltransferase family 4 protein n=1 Tax=uncultured Thiothrix sp. TaxID=223185 RepID=UPI002639A0BE|nr:glycosyltransferase family 4 protein [uncultured Thiothrix sp.]
MIKILEVCTASSPAYALVFKRAQVLNTRYPQQLKIDILCSDGQEVELMRQQGMQVILTDLHRSLNPWHLLQSLFNLQKVLRHGNYDVVHLHFGVPSLIGRCLAFVLRKPIWIYQSHGYSLSHNTSALGKFTYLAIERLLKWPVNLALFQSHEDIEIARRYQLLDEPQIEYLGNGIDTDYFSPSLNQLPTDKTIFGMVARFEAIKNHELLLDAVKHLRLVNPNFKVLLIGQGELQTEIAAKIAAHQLEDWMEIRAYSTNMAAFYQEIDVGLLTSFGEGLPRALLEPMACAKPVIGTNVKGSREAIQDQTTGFLVPVNDPQTLANTMQWLMEHPIERQRMGLAARAHVVEHFSAQHVLERLGSIYLACYEHHRRLAKLETSWDTSQ